MRSLIRTLLFVVVAFGAAGAQAQTVRGLEVSPTAIIGGVSVQGKVVLSEKAGTSGLVVTMTSSNLAATPPLTVKVPSGSSSMSFSISTKAVPKLTTATIKAQAGKGIAETALTIKPAELIALDFNPGIVLGGNTVTGIVAIADVAPSGGLTVVLSSSSTAWGGPSSVFVPGGASATQFSFTTKAVIVNSLATVTARYEGSIVSGGFTIESNSIHSFTLSSTEVTGGTDLTGTIDLVAPAPLGGLKIELSSNKTVADVPKVIVILAGTKTITFNISTTAVNKDTTASITAKLFSSKATASLTVTP